MIFFVKNNRLLRNTFFSAVARGSDLVFLLLLILAARYLGDEHFGKFSFAFALVSILEFFADFGLKELLIREIAREKTAVKTFIGNSLTLKIFLSILTIILIAGVTFSLPIGTDVRVIIYILTLSMVLKSFKFIFRSLLIAYERFDLEAYLVLFERLCLLIFGGGSLLMGYNIVFFSSMFMLTNGLSLIVAIFLIRKKIEKEITLSFDLTLMNQLLKKAIPFGLSTAGFMLYFRVDSLMLAFLRNDAEVGWYNASCRIVEGMIVIPTTLYYVLFPRLSILHEKSKRDIEQLVGRAFKFLISLSLPITGVGIIFSRPIIMMIYGEAYINSILALQILLVGVTFMFLWLILVVILNSTNHAVLPFNGGVLATTINIGINIFLIPRYGYIGASISVVTSNIFLFLFLYYSMVKNGYRLQLVKACVGSAIKTLNKMGAKISPATRGISSN